MKSSHFLSIKNCIFLLGLILVITLGYVFATPQLAKAEGSRENVVGAPNPATYARPCTEWRSSTYANLLRERTFFQVYVRQGEVINMGSSAKNVRLNRCSRGDIALWAPGLINSFDDSQKLYSSLPTPTLLCSSQGAATGQITSRAQELAGPLPNTGGYTPCTYTAPVTGIYWVAFSGPSGWNPSGTTCDQNCTPGTVNAPNTTNTQYTGVSMWDITIRSADGATTYNGRVFTDYLVQMMGPNGTTNRAFSTLFGVTSDGFVYQVNLNGLDPYGYLIYNNNVGYLNTDGSPLYHDVVSGDDNLTTLSGGVSLARPTGKLFFNPPASELPATIVPVPQIPSISNVAFQGSAGGNNGYEALGGDFTYLGNVGGISEIVISLDGVDFDPANPMNRVLRSVVLAGSQTLHWDGLDNSGNTFPIGNDFQYLVTLHAGEYHFPLLDAENSSGGPTLSLLNPPGGTCPFANCNIAFYDDRGYRTAAGGTVGTVGSPLTGTNPPNPAFSNYQNGYDTNTNQRAYGTVGLGTGFGNWKGLDVWAFYPSEVVTNTLNVLPRVSQDLAIQNLYNDGFLTIGSTAVYALRVSNVSTSTVTGQVSVTFDIPEHMTYFAAVGTGWACSYFDPTVTCTTMPSGGVPTGTSLPDIQITMQVEVTVGVSVSSVAVVANSNDGGPTNNTSSNTIPVRQYDFGDLPSSYNMTTLGQDGARHAVGPLYLGQLASGKNDAIPDNNAASDPQDDGIVRDFSTPWVAGNTVFIDAEVTGNGGYLVGWVDWGGDGSFSQPEEKIVFGSLPAGTHHLPITIPSGYIVGTTVYSRFRLYAGVQDNPLPNKASHNGEVEDYKWGFSPTAVTLTSFSAQADSAGGSGLVIGLLLVVVAAGLYIRRR